jgi:sporulation protein YtfJ
MESLKHMIDVNTIIGDPVETPDGSVILTVSKVGFGFAAGGSEFQTEQGAENLPFGGGSGGGVSITPIAFLIVNSQGVKTIHLDESTHLYERLLDLAPQAVEKIQSMLGNKNKQNQNQQGQGQSQQTGYQQGQQQGNQNQGYQQNYQQQNEQRYQEPPI